jgi:hypothetical protein
VNIKSLLQAAVSKYRSAEPNGSNGAVGLAKEVLHVSNGNLSRKVNPNDETCHCSPDEVIAICKATGDLGPLHAMAAALGCVLMPMAGGEVGDMPAVLASNVKEDGEWFQAAAMAYAAPKLSDNQLANAAKEGIESMSATARTLMHLYAKNESDKSGAASKPTHLKVARCAIS